MRTLGFNDFSGLNLNDAPDETGCIDISNVDLEPGAIRTRDGSTRFNETVSAGGALERFRLHVTGAGNSQVLAVDAGNTLRAYNSSGVQVATQAVGSGACEFAHIGTPTATYTYIADNKTNTLFRWDGSAFSAPAGMPEAMHLAVQSPDNRLVAANVDVGGNAHSSRVDFSEAGDPETWGANDFVNLHPGDGQTIKAVAAWRDLVFVFKRKKIFVFYGNSTNASGTTVFNYRLLTGALGCERIGAVTVGDQGVYFLAHDGVYLTTGSGTRKVSQALDPYFRGDVLPFFNQTVEENVGGFESALEWHDGRLFWHHQVADLTFVLDPELGWTVWNLGNDTQWVNEYQPSGADKPQLMYSDSTGYLYTITPGATTDNGTAIASRYRTGFYDLGEQGEKRLKVAELWGSGTVNLKLSRDFGSLDSARSAVLGTAPAIDHVSVPCGKTGHVLSHEFSASSGAWKIHRAAMTFRPKRVETTTTP